MSSTQYMMTKIVKQCDSIKHMLLEKNKSYGNSAAEPLGIFSKTTPIEQINVRIDDKLKRIKNGKEYKTDDTVLDLIGYLILRRIVLECKQEKEAINKNEEKYHKSFHVRL